MNGYTDGMNREPTVISFTTHQLVLPQKVSLLRAFPLRGKVSEPGSTILQLLDRPVRRQQERRERQERRTGRRPKGRARRPRRPRVPRVPRRPRAQAHRRRRPRRRHQQSRQQSHVIELGQCSMKLQNAEESFICDDLRLRLRAVAFRFSQVYIICCIVCLPEETTQNLISPVYSMC